MHPSPANIPTASSAVALNRTVDALTDDELAQASLLPGWTRSHVVAHVTLNAEALAGVLDGCVRDRPVSMYPSAEQRDADIEQLTGAEPTVLRRRLLTATTTFGNAVAGMRDRGWEGTFERTPGVPGWPIRLIPVLRWRELEIHHADLGTAYTHKNWPEAFAVALVESFVERDDLGSVQLRASDVARTWSLAGPGGQTVVGTVRDLGWWLTGRGDGRGLRCDAQLVPALGTWPTLRRSD